MGSTSLEALPRGRRRVLAVLTALLPVALFGLVELALRWGGWGAPYSLFVDVPGARGYLWVNHEVVRRFLVDERDTPNLWIRPVAFRQRKTPETYRIFVQGGSTAEGYPYGFGASPAGMLQQRLQHTFPGRRIEVITTAMSGVNSYTLLDFCDEILEQHPDAVVIYSGHNEYLGLLGVGSKLSAGRLRPLVLTFLGLQNLRLFQVGRRLQAALAPQSLPDPRRTQLARFIGAARIPYGSRLYRRGLEQYRANMRALLRRYREAGVPVFIGTLVANERDQPPFIMGHGPDADLGAWRRHLRAGLTALVAGHPAAALPEIDAAVAADRLHAAAWYSRGLALDELGRYGEARAAYLAAKDRDELRLRAPEEMNAILRRVAAEEGAHVVDVEASFHRRALHGIVGKDLMLEHLHPNLEGYFILADAFYRAFAKQGAVGPWTHPIPAAQARREMPVTAVDRFYGEYRIASLTSGWPFAKQDKEYKVPEAPADPLERIAEALYNNRYGWPDAMRELLRHYRRDGRTAEAAKVAVLLAEAFPYRAEDQRVAADLLRQAGRSDFTVYERRAHERRAASRPGEPATTAAAMTAAKAPAAPPPRTP
jgi:lysophospholipase L1-like esterase